jgi:hypothetical protein
MWNQLRRWFGGTGNKARASGRPFSIFEVSEGSSDALFAQIASDLHDWGYQPVEKRGRAPAWAQISLNSDASQGACPPFSTGCYDRFQSRQAAKRIVEKAEQSASSGTQETALQTELLDAIHANDESRLQRFAAERGDGVTTEDIRWYWSLHPVARAAMTHFDEELQGRMWIDRHAFHLCLADLEQDVKRQLPVFGDPIADDTNSPLPVELRRRFALFITRTRHNPSELKNWSSRLQRASSLNSLLREMILCGDFSTRTNTS